MIYRRRNRRRISESFDDIKRWEIVELDVWGNPDEGYNVNDIFKTGIFIELPENASNEELRKALRDAGYDMFPDDEVEDGDYLITIYNNEGKPWLELMLED